MSGDKPVGVIGLGLMGEVYTRRLIAAGFSVVGYDVDAAKDEATFSELGARPDRSPDIARDCELIVLAALNTDQVEEVVEAHAGRFGGRQDRAVHQHLRS